MFDSNASPAALAVDGFVLLVYFAGIVGLGLWAGRRNRNLDEFALGGRSIPWWAVLASIVAAETSAATFLGTPAEGFKTRSFVFGQLTIGTILARILIAATFIRPYYAYRVQSIYEFLEIRFGPLTRNLASLIFLFTRVLGIGVRLYLGGAIIKVICQYLFPGLTVDLWIYFWGILFITLLTTMYTAIGGIKAVVWTDLIQATLMISSMILAIVLLFLAIPGGVPRILAELGGMPNFLQVGVNLSQGFWPAFKSMLEEPYTIAAAVVGSTFFTMATHGTDQDMVQRMLTAKDPGRAQLSLVLSGVADLPIALCFLLVGILLWVYYQIHPDPNLPSADNEIFAHYIVSHMPIGVRGLIVAGVFATMMGSTSAALNALATSFTKDFFLPYFPHRNSPSVAVTAARVSTLVFGALMLVVATLAANAVLHDANLTIIPIALSSLGYTYGALLGVFLLGMLTRSRGRDLPNIFGMVGGITAVLLLGRAQIPSLDIGALLTSGQIKVVEWSPGSWLPNWLPAVSWPWWVLIGCAVCFGISVLFPTSSARVAAMQDRRDGSEMGLESGFSQA
jgi:solute:Na+ symporter, SSS family